MRKCFHLSFILFFRFLRNVCNVIMILSKRSKLSTRFLTVTVAPPAGGGAQHLSLSLARPLAPASLRFEPPPDDSSRGRHSEETMRSRSLGRRFHSDPAVAALIFCALIFWLLSVSPCDARPLPNAPQFGCFILLFSFLCFF